MAANPLDFTGKVVLVTGSSRGLGAEMISGLWRARRSCVLNTWPMRRVRTELTQKVSRRN